ncbi:hypothetical protein [Salinithrix halophila]|uniref:Uncharacterized protein n=1 Tax=Salinithrix halophila TaxID=1485204 RepID=A0ABV8JH00_9BACL
MNLKIKRITGLVRTSGQIDRTLRSQGFISKERLPPVYDIRIQDSASGRAYRLRIPTRIYLGGNGKNGSFLRLGKPSIACSDGKGNIPDSVFEAANHILAEIVSYLQPSPGSSRY